MSKIGKKLVFAPDPFWRAVLKSFAGCFHPAQHCQIQPQTTSDLCKKRIVGQNRRFSGVFLVQQFALLTCN